MKRVLQAVNPSAPRTLRQRRRFRKVGSRSPHLRERRQEHSEHRLMKDAVEAASTVETPHHGSLTTGPPTGCLNTSGCMVPQCTV